MTPRIPSRVPRRARALAVLLAAIIAPLAHADDRPGPDVFFQHARMTGATLSPDGQTVAMTVASTQGGPVGLVGLDLKTMQLTSLASFDDQDIANVHWVNDHRVVFDMVDTDVAVGQMRHAWGLYGVDTDGTHLRLLISQRGVFVRDGTDRVALPWNTRFLSTIGDQRGNEVYAIKYELFDRKEVQQSQLQVIDTLRGSARDIDAPRGAVDWVFDRKGELRVVTTVGGGRRQVRTRDLATNAWNLDGDFARYAHGEDFNPEFIDSDGTLFVSSNKDSNTTAIWN